MARPHVPPLSLSLTALRSPAGSSPSTFPTSPGSSLLSLAKTMGVESRVRPPVASGGWQQGSGGRRPCPVLLSVCSSWPGGWAHLVYG